MFISDASASSMPVPELVDGNSNAVHVAAIKLPEFRQHSPRLWFQHIEAQFQL